MGRRNLPSHLKVSRLPRPCGIFVNGSTARPPAGTRCGGRARRQSTYDSEVEGSDGPGRSVQMPQGWRLRSTQRCAKSCRQHTMRRGVTHDAAVRYVRAAPVWDSDRMDRDGGTYLIQLSELIGVLPSRLRSALFDWRLGQLLRTDNGAPAMSAP